MVIAGLAVPAQSAAGGLDKLNRVFACVTGSADRPVSFSGNYCDMCGLLMVTIVESNHWFLNGVKTEMNQISKNNDIVFPAKAALRAAEKSWGVAQSHMQEVDVAIDMACRRYFST